VFILLRGNKELGLRQFEFRSSRQQKTVVFSGRHAIWRGVAASGLRLMPAIARINPSISITRRCAVL
jgi:hypothetical protein